MHHLTEAQIQDYVRGACAPAELLSFDDHLAECQACRDRSGALAGLAEGVSALRSAVLPAGSHLTDEQVADYASSAPGSAARSALEAHVAACPACAREVDDLRAFARPGAGGQRLAVYATAAAVLIGLLIPATLYWRSLSQTGRHAAATLPGLHALAADERARVEAALRTGAAEPPRELAELRGRNETMMSRVEPESTEPGRASFALGEPVGTLVASDRPTFRWSPLPGTDAYTVTVSDDTLRVVDQSPPVVTTTWTPARPLTWGRTYIWQVTATRGDDSVTSPALPAPPARFRLLDAETAARLERMAREHPDAHLLLGILYAEAGVVAEARRRLVQVSPQDPYFEVARNTLDRLQTTADRR